jgi:hypothetical protein
MLFTTLALAMSAVGQAPAEWYEPFPAHKMIGNVHYVSRSKSSSSVGFLVRWG